MTTTNTFKNQPWKLAKELGISSGSIDFHSEENLDDLVYRWQRLASSLDVENDAHLASCIHDRLSTRIVSRVGEETLKNLRNNWNKLIDKIANELFGTQYNFDKVLKIILEGSRVYSIEEAIEYVSNICRNHEALRVRYCPGEKVLSSVEKNKLLCKCIPQQLASLVGFLDLKLDFQDFKEKLKEAASRTEFAGGNSINTFNSLERKVTELVESQAKLSSQILLNFLRC